MAEDDTIRPNNPHVSINGMDLSAFVKDAQIHARQVDLDAMIPGLRNLGPVTFTLTIRPKTFTCGSCGEPYIRGEEGGQITAVNQRTGERILLCPPCGVAMLEAY